MEKFSFIRHGDKLTPGKAMESLEESSLTPAQQEKWKEAVRRLGIENNPQIRYENLPIIEQMAKEMYEKLPPKATVVFSSTNYPRTRLTADLLSSELMKLINEDKTKEIAVAYMWESPEDAIKEYSRTNIGDMKNEMATNQRLMREVQKTDYPDDLDLEEYLKHDGNKTFDNEDEVLRKAVNLDLKNENSQYKKRVGSFRESLKNIKTSFDDISGPVFFYMVGHHPNLITFDVALNGREYYNTSDEIPKPLMLWEVDKEKIHDFINKE